MNEDAGAGPPPALVVFCKLPVPGRVKTRLAASVGDEEAAAIYRAMAEACLEEMRALEPGTRCRIAFDPPGAEAAMRAWLGRETALAPQRGADLGARMLHAFREAFAGGSRRVVVIGTDCPDLRSEHVREAMRHLETKDAVLGPSEDGGYYLIGLRRPHGCLFEHMPWSTGEVLQRTRETLRGTGLTWAELETLRDVDDENDLRAVRSSSSAWKSPPGEWKPGSGCP
jgi:rSAM/selenodomain-associated transferase 1